MICVISLILLSGNVELKPVKVQQVVWAQGQNLKIRYKIPRQVLPHYLNRGIVIVDKSKCVKTERRVRERI